MPQPTVPEPKPLAEPRARIANALRQRGEGGGVEAPGTPDSAGDGEGDHEGRPSSLPAMIAALPGDETRAPQTQFSLDLQIAFLETLAVSGSVRSAARRVKISNQSVYRARRSSAAFGRAWDVALVVARGQAEALLADYAIGGVEEDVWYHGEVVGKRVRVSDRLLLAHLGRLDRMRSGTRIDALAEDFDGMIAPMRAGEPIDAPVEEGTESPAPTSAHPEPVGSEADPEGQRSLRQANLLRQAQHERETVAGGAGGNTPGFSSSGQCNTRSMTPDGEAPADRSEPPYPCPGAVQGTDGGKSHYRRGEEGLEPVVNADGRGPCCDSPLWPECSECPHHPRARELLAEMVRERPIDAPDPELLGKKREVELCKLATYDAGDEDWYRYGEGYVFYERDAEGYWYEVEEDEDEGDEPAPPLVE